LRVPGDQRFRRLALELLVLEDGAISEIIDFSDPPLLDAFGLPPVL
jgi:hypothetical protein